MVRSRFHHVVTADDAQFGATMKRLPVTANRAGRGITGAMGKASTAMKGAAAQTRMLGRAIGSLGPAVGGFLAVGGVAKIIEQFDRVGKLAVRFGESAESIQRVSFASQLAGADVEKVAKAMMQATRAAQEAMDGTETYSGAFDRLGLSAAEFVNLSMEEKLKKLADAFNSAATEAEGVAAISDILGARVAGELIPLFRQGGDAIQEAFDKGTVASQKTVDNIQKLNDRWTSLKMAAAGPLATIVGWMEGVIESVHAAIEVFKTLGAVMGELIGGDLEAMKAFFAGDFDLAGQLFSNIPEDMENALGQGMQRVEDRMRKAREAFVGDGSENKRGGESTISEAVADGMEKASGSVIKQSAEDAFTKAQKQIDEAAEAAAVDRLWKKPDAAKKVNRGGGLVGMWARMAGAAMQGSSLTNWAGKSASAKAAGFGGLGGLYGMQAAKAAGVGPGQLTSLQTGGLGDTRALSRERFDARKRAREEAKNQSQGVEKSNELLTSIDRNLKDSISGEAV